MLEDIAGYVVLAPLIVTVGGVLSLAAWSNRRRLLAARFIRRRPRLA